MTQPPGIMITVEGIEGVGKSTAMHFLQHWLVRQQLPFIQTREPGGTIIAEQIRHILLKKQVEVLQPDAELLLVFAARAQHLQQVILPAIAQGQWVICDRFTDASYAYQGGGRGIPLARIAELEEWVQADFRPHAVFLLDAPVAICLERARQRGALDRIESEQSASFERARHAYLARAQLYPERYHLIDAATTVEQVQQQIQTVLETLMAQRALHDT